jgi:translation initiation factor IF-3
LKNFNLNWRINYQIRAPKVRVIGADGKQIGVLPIDKALAESKKAGLDLVEIAPKATPPVVKIIEIGKLKYEEEKKLRRERKGIKGGDTKEIRFSPFIGEHDFQIRLERIKEFLSEKNKVRIAVVFKGREMGSKQFGYDILNKINSIFKDSITIDMQPKFMGKHLITVISPVNQPKKTTSVEEKEK